MKRFLLYLLLFSSLYSFSQPKGFWLEGYYKPDGTYVERHYVHYQYNTTDTTPDFSNLKVEGLSYHNDYFYDKPMVRDQKPTFESTAYIEPSEIYFEKENSYEVLILIAVGIILLLLSILSIYKAKSLPTVKPYKEVDISNIGNEEKEPSTFKTVILFILIIVVFFVFSTIFSPLGSERL